MKIFQLFLFLFAFLMMKPASAGLLIEPVVGFNFANAETDIPNVKDSSGNGAAFGGRLGYQKLGLQLGLDYLRSSINLSEDKYKSALAVEEFAGFVGYELPVLFRVYAGYIFSSNADTKWNDGTSTKKLEFSEGSGMKAGIGFTGLPFVDINFEYRKGTWDKWKYNGNDGSDATNYSSFMIGLSIPLVL